MCLRGWVSISLCTFVSCGAHMKVYVRVCGGEVLMGDRVGGRDSERTCLAVCVERCLVCHAMSRCLGSRVHGRKLCCEATIETNASLVSGKNSPVTQPVRVRRLFSSLLARLDPLLINESGRKKKMLSVMVGGSAWPSQLSGDGNHAEKAPRAGRPHRPAANEFGTQPFRRMRTLVHRRLQLRMT